MSFENSSPSNSARVEVYLDQVLAPLTPRLSAFYQQELRRELRTPLWERIDAYRELGQSEDNAITEAFQQFGGAEDFLRQWQQEWRKTPPQAVLREIATATRCALLLSLPALLMTCPGSPVWPHFFTPAALAIDLGWMPDWLRHTPVAYVTSSWGSFELDLILLPLAVGAAVGRLVPHRAGLGMLAALTTVLISTDWIRLPLPLTLGWFAERISEQIFFCSILWLPLACTSAALSGWWTQRSKSRRLA